MNKRNIDKHIVPSANSTMTGYGKFAMNWGICGIPIRFVKVPLIINPTLPTKRLKAIPNTPIIIPIVLVINGKNINKLSIMIHIFNNLSTWG